jgi:DNA excision repair protein ERCC-2
MEVKASVKEIVELIYGSGDLISESYLLRRAEEGTKIHQEHQMRYKEGDQSEVYVEYQESTDEYTLFISGRIDGLIRRNRKLIVEEIKSTTKDLEQLDENTTPAHLAQAKMYAYFYLLKQKKKSINVRLTYIQVLTGKSKKFDFHYTLAELEAFFRETVDQYIRWLKVIDQHEETRNRSIEGLNFPFAQYREGQRELMGACYKTILNRDILYAIAPTGVGKTIATIFSSLKAINQKNQKIFYLTAKNLGKQVALKTVELLMANHLVAKTIEITAKDQICLQEVRDCDPEKCPYAKAYFKKLFPALQDLHRNETIFNKETILRYAVKHQVCPFEFSLDASYYADIIICDYNYAFCPRTHLIRYFDEEAKYQPILLVDEAHNLVPRSKEMYSGSISKIKILTLAKLLKENNCPIQREFRSVLSHFERYQNQLEQTDYLVSNFDEEFVGLIANFFLKIDAWLAESKVVNNKNEIIKILMELIRFVKVADFYDGDYVYTLEKNEDDVIVSINCLDAAKFLLKTLRERTVGCIFFSATLYPIEYYKKMLSENVGHFLKVDSPFPPENLHLIVVDDVSTRYKDRPASIEKIVSIIRIIANSKAGNYIVFFPSYRYLEMVEEELAKRTFDCEFIVQKRDFSIKEREEVISLFQKNDNTQIGLFVMGGMFSEGIDYIGDMLSGVIIVGTGLPLYGGYNNVVKAHFDEKFGDGFDFAYTYPGFSKVVQAVGRVIRSETDRGIAILVDDRFSNRKYQRLYPQEWSHMRRINSLSDISDELSRFWEN